VAFTVLQVKYSAQKRLLQGVRGQLALVKAGKCSASSADLARISSFLSASVSGPNQLLTVVSDETSFLSALRSGLYNVFTWFSIDGPPDASCKEDLDATCNSPQCATRRALTRELTELVFSGKAGLVVVRNRAEAMPTLREVLGLDAGGLTSGTTAVFPPGGALGAVSPLSVAGKAVNLHLLLATGAATYAAGPGLPGSGTSVALHAFTAGEAVTFGFDPSAAAPATDASLALRNATGIAAPNGSTALQPLSVAAVEIDVLNLAKPATTRVRESFDPLLTLLRTSPAGTVSAGLIEWQQDLATNGSAAFTYFVRAPDLVGTFHTASEIAALRASGAKVFGTVPLDLHVAESAADLAADAASAVRLLPASGHDGVIRAKIEQALSDGAGRPIAGRTDVEANLIELLDAIDQAKALQSVDPTAVRLALDELVSFWEARWSAY
jgi:hypothetical protein